MPLEVYLVTPTPVTLEALVRAGVEVDGQLAMVTLFGGHVLQLLDQANTAVLTVESSRLLEDPIDATRIVPALTMPAGPLWWTEVTTPWGTSESVGVEIAERLAGRLEGMAYVQDGR